MAKRDLEPVQHTHEVPYTPGLLPHAHPLKSVDNTPISSVGKLAPKPTNPPSLFKPVLDAPALVKLTFRIEQSVDLRKQRVENNMTAEFQRRDELEKETMLKIKESAGKTQAWNNWKNLSELGAIIIAAISTIVGSYFIASTSSTLIGAAMIASGMLTMANFVFEHTDVWDAIAKKIAGGDEALEKKLRTALPTALAITSTVLALGGTAGAVAFHSLDLSQKVFSIGQTASHLIQGTLTIGAGVHENRAKKVEIALDEIKIEETQVKFQLETDMYQLEEFCKFIDKFVKDTNLIVKATLNTIQITQQPV